MRGNAAARPQRHTVHGPRALDAQWTDSGRTVDGQWTYSGQSVDSQWTFGFCGVFVNLDSKGLRRYTLFLIIFQKVS